MTFESLLELYPQASLVEIETDDPNLLFLFNGQSFTAIPRKDLNESEIILLQSLFPREVNNSKWYQYLVHDALLHNRSLLEYQVIHFKTRVDAKMKDMWLTTLTHYFDSFEDSFFVQEDCGLIALESQKIDLQALRGFVQTMDDDFSSKTSLYIGEPQLLGEAQLSQVKEERELFSRLSNQVDVHSFRSAYLQGLIVPALSDSATMASYRSKILLQQDAHSLILSLWRNHANITQTSKDLFLHRNTLNYRLDKFYDEVGLSLRDLDDLLLCYLIIS